MKRVLVIDDQRNVREVVRVGLEMAGWRVDTADCGEEGVRMALESRPDAILLDVRMPDMDGPATFRRLRAVGLEGVPVVFLTADSRPLEQGPLSELDFRGLVVSKPFDPLTLGEQIADLLGWE